jgi:glycoprotein-N-acetylgalactosamine 3-beta-galactosyltransferase
MFTAPAAAASKTPPPRVLCWILTHPNAHEDKAAHINNTWGRHCATLLFMTTEHHPGLNTVVVDIGCDKEGRCDEDRGRLWNKSRESWMHTYATYLETHDWFLKADDDSYIAWPHLVRFLDGKDPAIPAYFGRPFNGTRGHYYAGGSGILLSQGALRLLGDAATAVPSNKHEPVRRGWKPADNNYWGVWGTEKNGPEDLLTGRAMSRVGVDTTANVDASGAQLFLPLGGNFEYNAKRMPKTFWFWKMSADGRAGPSCCAKHWIGVHYVTPPQMYLLDDFEHCRCHASTVPWPHLQWAPA